MRLGTAPALIVRPDGTPRATLLWYHGLGVSKETHLPELERFARAGILAVGIDVSRYASAPERLAYHEYRGGTHFFSEDDWEDAMRRTIEWVLRFTTATP